MARLSHKELKRGVIAASAGAINHAQGVALAARTKSWLRGNHSHACHNTGHQDFRCQKTGRPGWFFPANHSAMPFCMPRTRFARQARCFIPPFEDPDVIAGRGTIGMEILRQRPVSLMLSFCAHRWRRPCGWRGCYVRICAPKSGSSAWSRGFRRHAPVNQKPVVLGNAQ